MMREVDFPVWSCAFTELPQETEQARCGALTVYQVLRRVIQLGRTHPRRDHFVSI